ncbi:MAG: hypothetical protein VX474_04520 [Pseudomonadota bacterium]|nr:hypothetical protein [Pseudomonadota bacterium]
MNQTHHRSALADYLTILTGLFTILSGAYSLYAGGDIAVATETESYWDGPLRHAIAITLTVMGLYFFMDLSVKIAGRIVRSENSGLPGWLVFGLFYFGGMALYGVFQIVLQSNLFAELQISYFITSLVIWLALTIPLAIMSAFKPRR